MSIMGLAHLVQSGMRAISLSVGGSSAVSGMVQPNDRVDVLGTFTMASKTVPGEMETVTLTVLQDVTVLATGQRMANQAVARRGIAQASGYSTVTLEVTPREAELLVFAEEVKGRLVLSLRNPADVSFESDLPEIDFEHIEKRLRELNLYRQRNIRHKKNL
jgi:Flp pilus assembly protein CpaB